MKNGYLTESEAKELSDFLYANVPKVTHLISQDRGSCVLGNCISALVIRKGCRKPSESKVFSNRWSQCEQPEPMRELIKLALEKYPEYSKAIFYNSGNIY